MTPMGAVPISFELEAATLSAAIAKFGDAAEQAVQQTMRELQEMRREQASSLVIPDAAGGALPNPERSAGRAAGRAARHRRFERVPARIGRFEFLRDPLQSLQRGARLCRAAGETTPDRSPPPAAPPAPASSR